MRKLILFFSVFFAYIVGAQAANHSGEEFSMENYARCSDIADPFEKFNRASFTVNSVLDHFLLRPVAKGYRKVVSEEARDKVSNAVANTREPLTMANSALQLKGGNVLNSLWRFLINSTLGVGGMEDVAKKQGLYVEPQTFGSTLASYGVGPGPYVVLPIFGSTNVRDMFDSVVLDANMNPLNYRIQKGTQNTISGIKLVSDRARILPFTDHISKTSTDPYVAIRSAMHQNREKTLDYPSYYKCK